MPETSTPFHRRPGTIAFILVALVVVIVALAVGRPGFRRRENPLLTTPQLALERLTARTLYFNGPAQPWLLALHPELLTAETRDARSERSRAFAQAVAAPTLFRQLDRQLHFDTLFFVGDPSQYRTLLDHLVERKDFTMTYVDHTSIVFKRPAPSAWASSDLAAVRSRLGKISPAETAEFLALAAAKLTAAHREPEAKQLLDEALVLDEKSVEAWTSLAGYQMNRGEFTEALIATDRALKVDSRHLGALAIRAQVFYATKQYNEAYALSGQLVARLPDDPNILFKHAQIAHEAHAYKTEIATLEKLISLAEADHRSTTGYRVYLAQACTAAGQGQPAIDNFNRVLADPDLPADQRKFATESIERIKKRTGL
jgi:tetratricopeptide (TPR) repeat protein